MCFLSNPYHMGLSVHGEATNPDPMDRDQGVWDIGDIEGIRAGPEIHSPIPDLSHDRLIATFTDPDGDHIAILEDTV
jgi:hypothetical protein